MRIFVSMVAFLTAMNSCVVLCEGQEGTKSPRIRLPEALFSPIARNAEDLLPQQRNLVEGPVTGRKSSRDADATTIEIRCATPGGSGRGEAKPGHYLAFVQPYYVPFETGSLFRGYASDAGFFHLIGPPLNRATKEVNCCQVEVTSVGIDQVMFEVPAAASELFSKGSWVRIVLAFSILDSQREIFPAVANVSFKDGNNDLQRAELQLERVGNAILKYLGIHGHFPPHVVRGPDGKPWHSWRVLILPFLGPNEHKVFKQYDLTQPWNSKTNLALLPKMPDVYRAPANWAKEETNTHFAAALGEQSVFSKGNCTLPNEFRIGTFSQPPHYLQFPPNNSSVMQGRGVTDGSSNTILIGTVGTSKKIPWTKPADIRLQQNSRIGEPGGFCTCYEAEGEVVALFLFADGRVDRVPKNLPADVLKKLVTANAGDYLFTTQQSRSSRLSKSPEYTGDSARYGWYLQFSTQGEWTTALITRETP